MGDSYGQIVTGEGIKVKTITQTQGTDTVHVQAVVNVDSYTEVLENDSNGRPVYHGKALPGTLTSVTGWQIKKITYDASGFITNIQWASGTANFDKVWDSHGDYTYS